MNFITIHYAYFLGVCLVSAIIFWEASTPARSVTFTDSLFLTVSAMTLAGLNTVNLSALNTFQQFMLFVLIMLGSAVGVSSVVIYVRKNAFENRFAHIVQEHRAKRKLRRENTGKYFYKSATKRSLTARGKNEGLRSPEIDGIVVRGRAIPQVNNGSRLVSPSFNPGDHPPAERQGQAGIETNMSAPVVRDNQDEEKERTPNHTEVNNSDNGSSTANKPKPADDAVSPTAPTIRFHEAPIPSLRRHRRVLSMSGVGALPDLLSHPNTAQRFETPLPSATFTESEGRRRKSLSKYFISGGFIGRNSQFHSLSPLEREKLGGVEYRALKLLGVVVPLYFVLFQLFGCIGLGAWVANNAADSALQNGLNPWYTL